MKTSTLITLIVTILIFFISLAISPFYTGGDQSSYIAVYNSLNNLSLSEGYYAYFQGLSSREPVAFFISWASSHFLSKNEFVAIANSLLAFSLMRLFLKWKASITLGALITLSNFYFYVLYFAAERLKFGFIFLALSLLFVGSKSFIIHVAASVMSHAQLFIVYITILFKQLISEFFLVIKNNRRPNFPVLLSLLGLAVMVAIMHEQLWTKFNAYLAHFKGFKVGDVIKLGAFYFLTCFYTKERLQALTLFIPLIVVAILLGGDRVNLFGYFIFLFYALKINRGHNIGVYSTSIYFAYKTFAFLSKVIIYGNGFSSLRI